MTVADRYLEVDHVLHPNDCAARMHPDGIRHLCLRFRACSKALVLRRRVQTITMQRGLRMAVQAVVRSVVRPDQPAGKAIAYLRTLRVSLTYPCPDRDGIYTILPIRMKPNVSLSLVVAVASLAQVAHRASETS